MKQLTSRYPGGTGPENRHLRWWNACQTTGLIARSACTSSRPRGRRVPSSRWACCGTDLRHIEQIAATCLDAWPLICQRSRVGFTSDVPIGSLFAAVQGFGEGMPSALQRAATRPAVGWLIGWTDAPYRRVRSRGVRFVRYGGLWWRQQQRHRPSDGCIPIGPRCGDAGGASHRRVMASRSC